MSSGVGGPGVAGSSGMVSTGSMFCAWSLTAVSGSAAGASISSKVSCSVSGRRIPITKRFVNSSCHAIVLPAICVCVSFFSQWPPSRLTRMSSPAPNDASDIALAAAPWNCTRTWPFSRRRRKSRSAKRNAIDLVKILKGHVMVIVPYITRFSCPEDSGFNCAIGIASP